MTRRFAHCRTIAAIGNFGQIGNEGRLPWHDAEDLAYFKAQTMGGLCVVGKRTFETLPPLPGRDVYVWKRTDHPRNFAHLHQDRDIWIIGGAAIYRAWAPFVGQTILTHIDYDKKCDTYMPFLWRMPTPKIVKTADNP